MNKKYFPGGNTGIGFVNLFDGIIPEWEAESYTYILKGGPGVGKNTLMKRIVSKARGTGRTVEEFCCASDPDSLDAVRIDGIVILDGTAPHTIDPTIPGACQEIVNLGHFKNQIEFSKERGRLKSLFDENKSHYSVAYAFLAAAKALKESAIVGAKKSMDMPLVHEFISDFSLKRQGYNPRKLFLNAITPDGSVDFSPTVSDELRQMTFGGITGAIILSEAAKIINGAKVQLFMDPIIPSSPRGIILEDIGVFITADENLNECDDFLLRPLPEYIQFCKDEIKRLTDKAISELHQCKDIHDEIESRYRPFVDYKLVDIETDNLLTKLGL